MKVPVRTGVQTYRLVDERREQTIGDPVSLLMPGTRGGHLLLAFADRGAQGPRDRRRLGLAVSRGPAIGWKLLARPRGEEDATVGTRAFQLAFVGLAGRTLVFFERPEGEPAAAGEG